MFVPKPETQDWEPLPGVGPWREVPDDEFAALEADHDARYSEDQKGALRRWFDHVPDAPLRAQSASPAAAEPAGKE